MALLGANLFVCLLLLIAFLVNLGQAQQFRNMLNMPMLEGDDF